MDLDHYRKVLLDKENELTAHLALTGQEAKDQSTGDVEDATDRAVQSEAKDSLLNQTSNDYETLRRVREAIGRIDAGTFGACLRCGKPIETKRLEAVPWAEFDLRHQDEADRAESRGGKVPTL